MNENSARGSYTVKNLEAASIVCASMVWWIVLVLESTLPHLTIFHWYLRISTDTTNIRLSPSFVALPKALIAKCRKRMAEINELKARCPTFIVRTAQLSPFQGCGREWSSSLGGRRIHDLNIYLNIISTFRLLVYKWYQCFVSMFTLQRYRETNQLPALSAA